MAQWTEEGWQQLETIALNAALFTGFENSGRKVIQDAVRICAFIESNPGIGNPIYNIHGEIRFWHPFHEGKILFWRKERDGRILFVWADYSLPRYLVV